MEEPRVVGGIGEKKSNKGTQWYQQDRIYKGDCAVTIATCRNPYYLIDGKVRRLTPLEHFRLQGVRDDDITKICRNQTETSLYHLAGDSIAVDVLMAIFKEMMR